MKLHTLALAAVSTVALTAGAFAQEDPKELSREKLTVEQQRAYDYEYNRDEQCQGYESGVKGLGYEQTCAKDEEEEIVVAPAPEVMEVLNEYVVYFDFDEATVRQNDMDILRKAASEIQQYNPDDVLVAGYTDTRGSMEYNEKLSANRAENVSTQLDQLGVSNSVVDMKALGETELAVPTADGVKEQKNRRVVIQFVKS